MEHILYLTHRLPYPPDKGDKIRSYHLLKHLCRNYTVHLGTFIDDEADLQHVETVRTLCKEVYVGRIHPLRARVASLPALLSSAPLTTAYYRDPGLHRWIAQLRRDYPITRFLVFSSAMAQFVPDDPGSIRCIDFVDIDSDKWAQYATRKPAPISWVYRREARTLLQYERSVATRFDASLFVSEAEAELFKKLAPESCAKIDYFSNGVDTEYFSPAHALANPYPGGTQAIAFTGAMDYWPNVDAVTWFADEVFPLILAQHPQARFYIVGSKPTAAVIALGQRPNIVVTGRVPDVRPYLAHAVAAVAPLRIARGIQNKVLEAMAMAKTVFVTPAALEGIAAESGRDLVRVDDAGGMASAVNAFLRDPTADLGPAARNLVQQRFSWESNLARIDACLIGNRATAVSATAPRGVSA